jgi:hypothetical protein
MGVEFYPCRLNERSAVLWHNAFMPDEHPLTLRQVDQARGDLAAIADDLDFIKAQLARIPARRELARTALGVIFCAAALVILWIEAFWR